MIHFRGAGLHDPNLWLVTRKEGKLDQNNLQLRKVVFLLPKLLGLDKAEMSHCRTAVQNEVCPKLSIHNENLITGAVDDTLLQSPATQSAKALRLFCSELVVTVFQDIIGHSQNKFVEMEEDAQNEAIIVSVASIDA